MAQFTAAICKIRCDATVDALDAGTGTHPTATVHAVDNTLLASFNLSGSAAFGAGSSAAPSVATLAGTPITTTGESGAGTGTNASYVRFNNRDGTECFRLNATNDDEETDCVYFDNLSISDGQTVSLGTTTYTEPAGTA
jgi:hypothetical protein